MPPLALAVAAYFAVSTATAYMIIAVAVVTLASIGMMAMSIASMPDLGSQELKGRQQTVRSAVSPHRIIYGEIVAGGTLVFAHSYGDNNKFVYLVIALAGHEVQEISDVWLGDMLSTDAKFRANTRNQSWYVPSGGAVSVNDDLRAAIPSTIRVTDATGNVISPSLYTCDQFNWTIYFDASVRNQFVTVYYETSWVKVTKYLGAADQAADPELILASDGLWTSAHRLRGIAYIVVRLQYSPDVFPTGLPNIKCRIKGRKVYDPRTSLTAYSDNWALCVRDYLTADFGLGCGADEIADATFIAAANVSDELVTLTAGGATQKRYLCNGSFTLDQKPVDIMQRILSAGVGRVVWQQGQYNLKAGAYSSPVGDTLTESDLRGKITVQTKQSKQNRFNGVKGTFSDPTKNWQPSDFPLVKNDLYITEDSGEEVFKDIELAFTTDSYAAQRIAKILLEKNRQGITVNFPAKFTAFDVAVGDTKYVSIARLGWVNKQFEVIGWALAKDGAGVDLVLQEEAAACYDWNYGEATAVDPAPDTILPDPWTVSPPVNLSVTEELYRGNSLGDIKTRATLSWSPADGMAHRYRLQLNGVGVGETSDTQWSFNDVSTGPCQFSVCAVNSMGVSSPFAVLDYTVLGKTAPPPAVSSFLVARQPDGTREFSWTIDAPLDLAGYRIRYDSGSSSTWGVMAPLHAGLLTSSPYETNQLPAGNYIFAIVAEDTSGNQSPAVYIETTLEDPRLADVILDRYPHKLGWPGTLGDCYLDERKYLVAKDQKTWASFAADGVTWATWTTWARDPYDSITYTDEVIDLGVAVSFTPSVSVQADGSVTVEMRTSDDNSTWSAYGATGLTVKRYVQFRITVTNATGLATLKSVTVYLSGKPVLVEISDLATSTLSGSYRIGTGDIRLPVAGRFAKVNTVFITLQNVGAGWSYELVDKGTTYGPRVKIYNASNVLADATIDAYVKGV